MPLKIRLARGGAKKRPYYRIVVTDSRNPRDGRFLEKVGVYDPMLPREHAGRLRLEGERITHWLRVGAQPTESTGHQAMRSGGRCRSGPVCCRRIAHSRQGKDASMRQRLPLTV